jgi:hypothetical protein
LSKVISKVRTHYIFKKKITLTPMETIMNFRNLEYLEGLIKKGDRKMKIGGH